MLQCSVCEQTYAEGVDEPWRCGCGSPLTFAEWPRPAGVPLSFSEFETRRGLWAFASFLPMSQRVSLGEGLTPLVESADGRATFKLEYLSPSGSFKDRGAATTISRASSLGVERVVEDSSGNAGAAIATYAARAGLEADIFVPASISTAKRRAIERVGASLIPVEGSREEVTAACIERVESGRGWYASHVWNPAFLAGTSTFALEVCAQRDWQAPDAVVCPIGHGTLLLGAYRGFQTLYEIDWIDRMPRLFGAQAAGYDPLAAELHGPADTTNELADGLQIRDPPRQGELLEVIEATAGDVIAVSAEETKSAHEKLAEDGFHVEPTSAVAPAASERYRQRGVLDDSDDIIIPLTGRG